MSRKEILGKVYKMIPPMLESFHKGKSTPYIGILLAGDVALAQDTKEAALYELQSALHHRNPEL